ncbi:MAG: ABC transporter ATP-binding protein [Erysipelotrichaceae bacterium]|uniref:ABC transporter ATP-binding protein n=1 Tax=Floccifex sp. TaxID=2815810 RepID=UPI002A763F7C|nr:ABC transporter ATP-binding protein [Floccifex sp.]MDD7281340.1 ABC transporter ATP-binding protein [Erysipelotrichaceae bacterium]MDY2958925.1 ABC transporter ATP-binding protein [Floccifex sp.]
MIKINNVVKSYPDFELNCSLHVPKGMITGLIGKNGSGKSTLYKSILNIISIDSGSIFLFDKNKDELTSLDRCQIGVVLSDSFYSSYLSIKQIKNIMKNTYPQFDENYFQKKVKEYHLPEDKKIKEFSFGMKSKIKVICALSHNAKLLLLDEPTLGLDVVSRDEILDLLREFMSKDEDNAILISTHISSDIENLCDTIYMIDNGRILLHEDMDVLLSDYAILKVSEDQFHKIDTSYILRCKKEAYGYSLLTNQKQFYVENYPSIVIENNTLDDFIFMMIKGERL